MPGRSIAGGLAGFLVAAIAGCISPVHAQDRRQQTASPPPSWSTSDRAVLRSLWIGSLPDLPADPSNAVGDDPRAADFGHRLFFDKRFSANGAVACATCHQPENGFTDGLPLSRGIGRAARHTMSLVGVSYGNWFFWDGRKDTLWSQALSPLENPVEHGGTRTRYARIIAGDRHYRESYRTLFGTVPDVSDPARFPVPAGPAGDQEARRKWRTMAAQDRETVSRIFANIGKVIAAYERLIRPGPSRFDDFAATLLANDAVAASRIMSADERAGLRLFIGKGRCVRCHNGPLFTNNDFHNTGIPEADDQAPDDGRASGIAEAKSDPFNCVGRFSEAGEGDCAELRFAKTSGPELAGRFKTPSLRNVARTAPYMHNGQLDTLADVLAHYNTAPGTRVGHTELVPLGLTPRETARLEAFLRTLDGALSTPARYLKPPR